MNLSESSLRISTPAAEGFFQAAKWLKIQALVDPSELALLFEATGPSFLFPLSNALPLEEFPMRSDAFLAVYSTWIEALKEGKTPADETLRPLNALAWSSASDDLWFQEIPGKRYLAKPCKPLVQVQVHKMHYSTDDGQFRPMTLSSESIFWGVQFSFPQVYQDPKTMELLEVKESPNSALFQSIRKWSREHSIATPMLVQGKRVNLPIRLGKRCFPWINRHVGLTARGFSVLEIF